MPSIKICFDDKQVIEGKATAFTNGAIEAAIVHCRALLEFLGVRAKTQTELAERERAKSDDIGVEHFTGLSRITVQRAMRAYDGPKGEAAEALAYVIHLANKGLAHTTSSFTKHDRGSQLLDIAFRGVPALMFDNFYRPLNIAPPEYPLKDRKRDALAP